MLEWIEPGQPLPDLAIDPHRSGDDGPAGLVAAGRDLSADRLIEAYSRGIFPWYTEDQPVLWWSPDPRMVLFLKEMRIRRSLKKTLRQARSEGNLRVTLNQAFESVMRACAEPREHQQGTWITEQMVQAYVVLHERGMAHSVEVWRPPGGASAAKCPQTQYGELVGGLYGVGIGRMFFGESMFARVSDASKIALVCLTHMLNKHGFRMIDCQQKTGHLASFGARETTRADFLDEVQRLVSAPAPDWQNMTIEIPQV